MDDRQSIYLDTISIASSSTIGNNRRSLALSRQTIYHSAEDINETDNPNYNGDSPDYGSPGHYGTYPRNGILKNNSNGHSNRSSSPAAAANRDQGQVSEEEVEYYARKLDNLEGGRPRDEVTAPLYTLDEYDDGPVVSSSHSTDHLSNKTKKETITYSQWKARVKHSTFSSSTDEILLLILSIFLLAKRKFVSRYGSLSVPKFRLISHLTNEFILLWFINWLFWFVE